MTMDIFMNLTDMNTIIFSWIISADISMLLKFLNMNTDTPSIFMDIVCVIDFFIVVPQVLIFRVPRVGTITSLAR